MYKYSGDYSYRRAVGDYMAARGDPFLRGLIKGIGKIGGTALGLVPGGGAIKSVASLVGTTLGKPRILDPRHVMKRVTVGPATKIRLEPGTATAIREKVMAEGEEKKRRRINALNPRALTRANRRIEGFIRHVKRSLKHTPYRLARRGSFVRGGSPGVITKSEAARALRR